MPFPFWSLLLAEVPIVQGLARRDLPKKLGALVMILILCGYAGAPIPVLLSLGLLVLLAEVLQRLLEHEPEMGEHIVSPRVALAMLCIHMGAVIAYLWPAILLAQQPSSALLLAGFLWLAGVFVHITNNFVVTPLFNWCQMLPGFGMAFAVFLVAARVEQGPSIASDWWIATALLFVYALNTVETIAGQNKTKHALMLAQAESGARLRALERMMRRDGLTGLLNRQAFDTDLGAALSDGDSCGEVTVLLVDLDGFKPINDSYGHKAGDRVLTEVAKRLTEAAGEAQIVARLGGDEFAMAMSGLRSNRVARRFAEHVARRIERPIEFEGVRLRVNASIGIARSSSSLATVTGICAAADQAMYQAKGADGARVLLYDPVSFAPRPSLFDREEVVAAMQNGEIRPHYQPKADLETGRIVGFEALARWEHPARGLLTPSQFLPLVDEFGLQGAFLSAIARQVLTDMNGWLADGLSPGRVSINVPEVTLATHSGIAELDRLLAAHPDPARHLTLEITEDVFIARAGEQIQAAIQRFRRAGLRVSLDDFGTGFASFQHLRQLDFDELKIDVSFVQGLGQDPTAEVLVAGFLQIAQGLGVDVIAEGVETDDQRRRLIEMGCRHAQGWYFGKALPVEEARIRLFAEVSQSARVAAQAR